MSQLYCKILKKHKPGYYPVASTGGESDVMILFCERCHAELDSHTLMPLPFQKGMWELTKKSKANQ